MIRFPITIQSIKSDYQTATKIINILVMMWIKTIAESPWLFGHEAEDPDLRILCALLNDIH
jgi:hypothetical protein